MYKTITHKGQTYAHHSDLSTHETALRSLYPHQTAVLCGIAGVILVGLIVSWHMTLTVLIALATIVYFADLLYTTFLIFSGLAKGSAIEISEGDIAEADMAARRGGPQWPTYTVFCPLYKEWQVVPQFVKAMNALDYPGEKLQIMFLLEENDKETIEKISAEKLPANFEIVIVPDSKPKTKPKAMNFGLSKVRGEYLVIYDAEDVPDPLQLKRAVLAFRRARPATVCIQAKLNFYNPRQNLITRIFTAEYSLWFDLVLPGLQSIDAPIPLGGTSNHFQVSSLRELSGWDAFNVTEDCDLGIRLAKRGYRTQIVNSTTQEEANSDLRNWYNQRSRWIKGYIQTYIVHMRHPGEFLRGKGGKKGRFLDLVSFQLTVGAKVLSMFINPFMWAITISYFAFRPILGPTIESFFPGPVLYIGVFCLVFGNFLYLYNYMIGCVMRRYTDLVKYVFAVPFYWLGMSFAAWKALYEVFVKPHYWSKTIHGLHLPAGASAPSL